MTALAVGDSAGRGRRAPGPRLASPPASPPHSAQMDSRERAVGAVGGVAEEAVNASLQYFRRRLMWGWSIKIEI